MDVFATIMAWAGAHATASPHARPLPTVERGERRLVFAEYSEGDDEVRLLCDPRFGWLGHSTAGFCRPEDRRRGNQMAVIDFPWKLVWHDDGQHFLFDVEADPRESTDLAGTYPEVAARLRKEAVRIRGSSPSQSGIAPATLEPERVEQLRALGYVVADP
jgi:hypothetical protein